MLTSRAARPMTLGWQAWAIVVVVLGLVLGAGVFVLLSAGS